MGLGPASQEAVFDAECLGFRGRGQGREAEEPPLTPWQDPWSSDKLVLTGLQKAGPSVKAERDLL